MSSASLAGDYAALHADGVNFYYGYEVTTPTGEWCFEASINDKTVATIPESKLGVRSGSECAEFLLAGIGIVLYRFKLVEKD